MISQDQEVKNGNVNLNQKDEFNEKHKHNVEKYAKEIIQDQIWSLIDYYYDPANLNQCPHQIKSFNDYLDHYLSAIISQYNPTQIYLEPLHDFFKTEIQLRFENVTINCPIIEEANKRKELMTPAIARLRNMTYESDVFFDLRVTVLTRELNTETNKLETNEELNQEMIIRRIHLFKKQIMVGCNRCNLQNIKISNSLKNLKESEVEQGGYFIDNGTERVIITEEGNITNRIYRVKRKIKHVEVKSALPNKIVQPRTLNVRFLKQQKMTCPLITTFFNQANVPMGVLFRAFGVERDDDIVRLIFGNDYRQMKVYFHKLIDSLEYATKTLQCRTRDDALTYLASSVTNIRGMPKDIVLTSTMKRNYVIETLDNLVLPHLHKNNLKKAHFLGKMIHDLILYTLDFIQEDDRDSYLQKRMETPGLLEASLTRQLMTMFTKEIRNNVIKDATTSRFRITGDISDLINPMNISKIIRPKNTQEALNKAHRIGNYNIRNPSAQTGVSQTLSRQSYSSSLSQYNRINSKIKKTNRLDLPRKLHPTSWGIICPSETPEGHSIGGVKNLASMTEITCYIDPNFLFHIFESCDASVYDIKPQELYLLYATEFKSPEVQYFLHYFSTCEELKHFCEKCENCEKCEISENCEKCEISEKSKKCEISEKSKKCKEENDNIDNIDNNDKINTIRLPLIIPFPETLFELKQLFDYSLLTTVYLNGETVGFTEFPVSLTKQLRKYKRQGIIHYQTSVSFTVKNREINIYTDSGRLCRPLIYLEEGTGNLPKSFFELTEKAKHDDSSMIFLDFFVKYQLLEYLDVQETDNARICFSIAELLDMTPEQRKNYEYVELHPSLILGRIASSIPYNNCNQAPRNTYGSAMSKQPIGRPIDNHDERMDTAMHVLNYPARPLVFTNLYDQIQDSRCGSGFNVVIAVLSHGGFNQEDSIHINQRALDRGLFSNFFYRTYRSSEKSGNGSDVGNEQFTNPDPLLTRGMKPGSYGHLDTNGIAKVEHFLNGGDIVIGKVRATDTKSYRDASISMDNNNNVMKMYRDMSTTLRQNERGTVDQVLCSTDSDERKFVKVKVRESRMPIIGDKFSSQHGQKGTIGMVIPEEDMPYTKDGIRPDIIMNPHAWPSRMTIGQALEQIASLISAATGRHVDATQFSNIDVNDLCDILQNKIGMQRHCNQVMYSGYTGRMLECDVFTSCAFYMRLKHQVEDKIHARERGPHVTLTRQPADGRSRDGGLRLGEMERDALLSHATALVLHERMVKMSDGFRMAISKKSGRIAAINKEKGIYNTFIDNDSEYAEIVLPYSMKLLMQELEQLHIVMRLNVDS